MAAQYTEATSKGLEAAVALAKENSNPVVTPLHLASALLEPSSLFDSVLQKAGGDVEVVKRNLAKAIVRLPVQDPCPDDVSLSPQLSAVIRNAQKAMLDKVRHSPLCRPGLERNPC